MKHWNFVLVPIMFATIYILAHYRSKYKIRRLFQDHVEIYLIENKYRLIHYKQIWKLTLRKPRFIFKPSFTNGSPFSTVFLRVDVEDENKITKFFEVKITTFFGELSKIQFFENKGS